MQQHFASNALKKASLHITPARLAALEIFATHEKPLDAQHLIDELHKELGVDRVTVFRILNAFTEKGILRKLEFGEGKARYELSEKGHHHHLICEQCGKITDITDASMSELERQVGKKHHFLVRRHTLEFFGLCQDCQS